MRLALALALICASASALVACSPTRDVVPESREVHASAGSSGSSGASGSSGSRSTPVGDGYAYVARRAHGAVGLIGAHFIPDADAQRLVDRIADDLEACAIRLESRAALVSGAVQLVAATGSRGTADVTDIRFSPGGPVAANALECIVAPLRASTLGSASAARDAGVPALAIEATWAPLGARATVDAGGAL